jgi:hypothetical protein
LNSGQCGQERPDSGRAGVGELDTAAIIGLSGNGRQCRSREGCRYVAATAACGYATAAGWIASGAPSRFHLDGKCHCSGPRRKRRHRTKEQNQCRRVVARMKPVGLQGSVQTAVVPALLPTAEYSAWRVIVEPAAYGGSPRRFVKQEQMFKFLQPRQPLLFELFPSAQLDFSSYLMVRHRRSTTLSHR